MELMSELPATAQDRRKMGALRPTLRSNHGAPQYGGFCFSRCALAASIHHARSSAKRGNACDSALPPSPAGFPSSESVCAIGPAAIELEITTMPISESVPCQASAARTPEKRPAE